jgi:Holliday junction resolvase RusA-like endonuclease
VSNELKKLFKVQVAKDIRALNPVSGTVKVIYTIWYPTKREFDIDNIGSVITKFTHDALVELGVLVDDNFKFVSEIHFKYGGVDKDNPRCDVEIQEIDDG